MKLELKHGICLIDDSDGWMLDGWYWWSGKPGRRAGVKAGRPLYYAAGEPSAPQAIAEARLAGIPTTFPMHRRILGMGPYSTDRRDVDHVNGDGLDNRRENLRATTRPQNLANTAGRGGTSSFKGVSFESQTRRWKAQITVDGRHRGLGRYDTEEEAAFAYNAAAFEAWGDHARLNDVPDDVVPVRKPRATSSYRGVSFDRERRCWIAQIMIAGRQNHLGRYSSEIEAALAYNAAALAALGDRARLNAIPPG